MNVPSTSKIFSTQTTPKLWAGLVSAMATHRGMADYDNQMVRQSSLGQFEHRPMKSLNEKRVKLGIFRWLPLSADKLMTNKEAFERKEARAGHQVVDDDPYVGLILSEHRPA